ncbi:MAG TPA: hypothetical protein PLB26_21655, partial [Rubrivivax sp.]|nr:hypothetical protein [Rubrivivax sp.]
RRTDVVGIFPNWQQARLLRLMLLASDIVEAILDGRQSGKMTLPALMEPFPVEWERPACQSARKRGSDSLSVQIG